MRFSGGGSDQLALGDIRRRLALARLVPRFVLALGLNSSPRTDGTVESWIAAAAKGLPHKPTVNRQVHSHVPISDHILGLDHDHILSWS